MASARAARVVRYSTMMGLRPVLEHAPQRRHRGLCLLELPLHAPQVRGDDRVARGHVRRLQHGPDLLQRHAQVAQPADDLRGRDLTRPVQPVTSRRVDVRRLQQAYLVVMTQRLDAQVGHPGEVADRQQHLHGPYDGPSGNGRVKPASPQW